MFDCTIRLLNHRAYEVMPSHGGSHALLFAAAISRILLRARAHAPTRRQPSAATLGRDNQLGRWPARKRLSCLSLNALVSLLS
jgi:hypothetical protein